MSGRRAFLAGVSVVLGLMAYSAGGHAAKVPPRASEVFCLQSLLSFDDWLRFQEEVSRERLMRNVSPPGTARGVVIASPSRHNPTTGEPDYFYHWVRDAALVMGVVTDLFERERDPGARTHYLQALVDYARFSRGNQLSDAETGLGEPKFEVTGEPYRGAWGRPQNDGPALRAVTAMRIARWLMAFERRDLVDALFYKAELPAHTLIKADLEYISHHWREPSTELWEEEEGTSFYTRMAQWRALSEGADFARFMGDPGAADWYEAQAAAIYAELDRHWDGEKGYIRVTIDHTKPRPAKASGLDVATVLAVLHSGPESGAWGVMDARLQATVARLEEAFTEAYPINQGEMAEGLSPAIGRYPGDEYYGGNPWALATAGLGEYHYRLAIALSREGALTITAENARFWQSLLGERGRGLAPGQELRVGAPLFEAALEALMRRGDRYLARVRLHADADGGLAEQWRRESGYSTSARDLTWSYAAFLSAVRWRKRARGF